jgi:peptide deformylase
MKIVHAPNSILATSVLPVTTITKKIKSYIKDMVQTLDNQNNPIGVGLAANQVGLNLAIFVIKPTKKTPVDIFINPTIIESKEHVSSKKESTSPLEGCLSIPRIWGEVNRYASILLKYQTMNGEWKEKWFTGFKAIIIQHEVDHLNGVLFTQRILEQNGVLYEEKNGKLHEKSI